MERCQLCPRRCGVKRGTDGAGYCGQPEAARAARAALHFGEEPCISGTRGSGAVFFTGCTLRCVFCQNAAISRKGTGAVITPQRLADIFRELVAQGAHTISLVSPTPFVPAILEALRHYRPPVPIVYNTGGYERVETLRALEGAVDVYLPDLKYHDASLAEALSGATDYVPYAQAAILEMARQTGPMQLDADGIVRRGTMVRHLALPGHTRDSMAVMDWLADTLQAGVWVSLLFQYTPMGNPDTWPELQRRLTARECEKLWNHLLARGLTDGYVQDRESAGKAFIPLFDGTGVQRAEKHERTENV